MALTERAGYTERPGKMISVPIASGERIFDGALVAIDNSQGSNQGRLINWDDTGTPGLDHFFLGIARITDATGVGPAAGESKVGDTAGNVFADVDTSGVIIKNVVIIGATLESTRGQLVYADDENTFTTIATTSGNPVGWIVRFIQSLLGDVKLFEVDSYRAHRDI